MKLVSIESQAKSMNMPTTTFPLQYSVIKMRAKEKQRCYFSTVYNVSFYWE